MKETKENVDIIHVYKPIWLQTSLNFSNKKKNSQWRSFSFDENVFPETT